MGLKPASKKASARSKAHLSAERVHPGRDSQGQTDYDGAREHLSKYLELVPKAPDAEVVKAALAHLGKTEAAGDELVLEAPRENPVSAEGEAWVPGGLRRWPQSPTWSRFPSYPQFFSQYCRLSPMR